MGEGVQLIRRTLLERIFRVKNDFESSIWIVSNVNSLYFYMASWKQL